MGTVVIQPMPNHALNQQPPPSLNPQSSIWICSERLCRGFAKAAKSAIVSTNVVRRVCQTKCFKTCQFCWDRQHLPQDEGQTFLESRFSIKLPERMMFGP